MKWIWVYLIDVVDWNVASDSQTALGRIYDVILISVEDFISERKCRCIIFPPIFLLLSMNLVILVCCVFLFKTKCADCENEWNGYG